MDPGLRFLSAIIICSGKLKAKNSYKIKISMLSFCIEMSL